MNVLFSLMKNTMPFDFVIDYSGVVILIFFCLFIMLKAGFRYPEIEDEKNKGICSAVEENIL
ncbi:hypothetical protein CON30_08725 [Bacillus cereus]|nr:hypothetical protein CON30_08725 [Bacillus cereus]PER30703.1 hypothetical protein CN490_08710 [Bacillus cereus]